MFSSSLFVVSVASLLSFTAAESDVLRRTAQTQPPCTVPYTPFKYVGCYSDPSVPRALPFEPSGYNWQNSTVEKCTAACKGGIPQPTLSESSLTAVEATATDMLVSNITGNASVVNQYRAMPSRRISANSPAVGIRHKRVVGTIY